jgi:hypothetical protein
MLTHEGEYLSGRACVEGAKHAQIAGPPVGAGSETGGDANVG